MRPVVVAVTGNGGTRNSAPVVLDYKLTPFNVGLFFATTGATTAFKVQFSGDDPWATYATNYNTDAVWQDHPFMTAMTATSSGNVAFAVRAVRLQANASGTDTGTFTVVQSG